MKEVVLIFLGLFLFVACSEDAGGRRSDCDSEQLLACMEEIVGMNTVGSLTPLIHLLQLDGMSARISQPGKTV